jgi:putative hemolysin
MIGTLLLIALACAGLACLSGAVAYALRDFSRPKLEEILNARGRSHRLEPIIEHAGDFTLIAASVRLLSILFMLAALTQVMGHSAWPGWAQVAAATSLSALLAIFFSVAVASSLAHYFAEGLIARLDPYLHGLRAALWPLLLISRAVDRTIFRVSPNYRQDPTEKAEQEVEEEILAVVEEGEKEGVVDESDRELIESAIQFRDTTAGQIMTPRPQIAALPVDATVDDALALIESSGHSRLPVFDPDLDHIVGVLYARDMLRHLSAAASGNAVTFDLKQLVRPVLQFPESKTLKGLLQEFRLRQVHIAIVLDEFGGTAGLVTIEDILEELVGEITDEHEPSSKPAVLKLSDDAWEIDASTRVEEVNSVIGLAIPEDAGYETLGGYVSSLLGHIPEKGEEFKTDQAAWKVLEAEPTRVVRVRITLTPLPTSDDNATESPAPADAQSA